MLTSSEQITNRKRGLNGLLIIVIIIIIIIIINFNWIITRWQWLLYI